MKIKNKLVKCQARTNVSGHKCDNCGRFNHDGKMLCGKHRNVAMRLEGQLKVSRDTLMRELARARKPGAIPKEQE